MTDGQEYPDLSRPMETGDYPDLSRPANEQVSNVKQPEQIKLPLAARIMFGEGLSPNPWHVKIPARARAVGQGIRELYQGAKQLGEGVGESFGLLPEGTQANYTKQVDEQRKAYEQTPGARDPLASILRGQVNELPMYAAFGPLGSRMGLLKKMLAGGGIGAGAGATKYVPRGEDRGINVVKGTAEGAGAPLVFEGIPRALGAVKRKFGEAFTNTEPYRQAMESATSKYEEAKKEYLSAQGKSMAATPEALERKITASGENMAGIPEEQVSTLPIPSSQESGIKLAEAQQKHEAAKTEAKNIEHQMGEHLNRNAVHDVRISSRLDDTLTAERRAASKEFEDIKDEFSNHNIVMSNPERAKEIVDEITSIVRSGPGGATSKEAKMLMRELEEIKNSPTIRADKYLSMKKSVEGYAREARKKAYQTGINEEVRQKHLQDMDELDETADRMSTVLENGVGKENAERLKKANEVWRTRIIPLQKNRTYQKMHFTGKMPENIMKEFRGWEPGDNIMKNEILKDPELLRNVVGQNFSKNPEKLHGAGELEQPYLENMPELQGMLAKHKELKEAIPLHENAVNEAGINHKNILNQEKSAHDIINSQSERIAKNEKKRNKLLSDIEKMNKQLPELRARSNEKGISLKEKLSREKEYNEILSKKKKAITIILGTAGVTGLASLGSYPLYKIINLLKSPIAEESTQ